MNYNSVGLQGNLVDDPKVMGSENNVARFTIACNDSFGENESTAFIDCVAFGKQVETIQKHLTKGKQIIVEGRLQQNRWEDGDGNKRSRLEVRVNRFHFVSGGARQDQPQEEPLF